MENVDKKRSVFALEGLYQQDAIEESVKRVKMDDGMDVSLTASTPITIDALMSKLPSSKLCVRPGDPIADFSEMISRTDLPLWDKAVQQLSDVIYTLVSESVSMSFYTLEPNLPFFAKLALSLTLIRI